MCEVFFVKCAGILACDLQGQALYSMSECSVVNWHIYRAVLWIDRFNSLLTHLSPLPTHTYLLYPSLITGNIAPMTPLSVSLLPELPWANSLTGRSSVGLYALKIKNVFIQVLSWPSKLFPVVREPDIDTYCIWKGEETWVGGVQSIGGYPSVYKSCNFLVKTTVYSIYIQYEKH